MSQPRWMPLFAPLLLACQTYDFTPVTPLTLERTTTKTTTYGTLQKPSLMFVVDRSGSMEQPVNPGLAGCQTGSGVCGPNNPCNPAQCPTRLSELKGAMPQ